MTPEEKREKELARKRAYREANREKLSDKGRAYYEANREKVSAKARSYYNANREKVTAQVKSYRESNRDRVTAYDRARGKSDRESLRDNYVSRLIGLPVSRIPQMLLEAKREQILTCRCIKQLQTTLKEKETK